MEVYLFLEPDKQDEFMSGARKMKETLIKLLVVIATVLAPIKGALITCGMLVIIDLITGIWASKIRKEAITSAGIRRTVSKLFVYEIAIILAYFTEGYLTGADVPVLKVVTGLVGVTELLSCLENINTISGTNVLKTIIDKIGSENAK